MATTNTTDEGLGAPEGTSGDPTPMFQMSDPNVQNQSGIGNLDLDDLFVDCYFDIPNMQQQGQGQAADESEAAPPAAAPAPANAVAQPAPVISIGSEAPTTEAATTPATAVDPSDDVDDDKKRSAAEAGLDLDFDKNEDGKDLTDKQKLERRERNREHAKRSRLRKKFLLESLQEQIHGLQEQMEKLKDALRQEIPNKAAAIIDDVCGNKEKYTPLPMPSGFGPVKTLMEPDFRLMSALSGSQQNFAISDPTLPDNPIVYVSQGFLDLTGYTLDQVLGRNCRFLQGPGTDQSAVDVIRKGINEGVDTSVCLLNYKADGTPFWNQFFVAALRDAENNVVNYVGVQCEVSKAVVEKHMGDKKKKV